MKLKQDDAPEVTEATEATAPEDEFVYFVSFPVKRYHVGWIHFEDCVARVPKDKAEDARRLLAAQPEPERYMFKEQPYAAVQVYLQMQGASAVQGVSSPGDLEAILNASTTSPLVGTAVVE